MKYKDYQFCNHNQCTSFIFIFLIYLKDRFSFYRVIIHLPIAASFCQMKGRNQELHLRSVWDLSIFTVIFCLPGEISRKLKQQQNDTVAGNQTGSLIKNTSISSGSFITEPQDPLLLHFLMLVFWSVTFTKSIVIEIFILKMIICMFKVFICWTSKVSACMTHLPYTPI